MSAVLQSLPLELWHDILLKLAPEDMYAFWTCSRITQRLFGGDYFFKTKCEIDGYLLTKGLSNNPTYKKFCNSFGLWKGLYLCINFLNNNWKNNVCRTIELDNSIDIELINYINEEILIVTTWQSQMFLLNSSTGRIEKCVGLIGDCRATSVFEDLLYSAEDPYPFTGIFMIDIRVWNLKTRSLVTTERFRSHQGILELYAYKNLIGIRYKSLEFCILIINNNALRMVNMRVNHVYFHENLLIHQHQLHGLHIREVQRNSSEQLVCCERSYFKDISMKNKYLISWCSNGHVFMWDVESRSKLFKFTDANSALLHPNVKPITFIDQNQFFLCKEDSKVEVWSVETKSKLFQIDCETKIYKILTNSRFIFTFLYNCTVVKIWCAVKGKCVTCLELRLLYPEEDVSFSTVSVTESQLFIIKHGEQHEKYYYILDYGVNGEIDL